MAQSMTAEEVYRKHVLLEC